MSKYKNVKGIRKIGSKRRRVLSKRGECVTWSIHDNCYIWAPKIPLTKQTAECGWFKPKRKIEY
jgi:hypothetical protein